MAGHSQFANIKHRKGAQDAKKARLFTKLQREITVAAREGQPDPEFNSRLRNAIITARENNMPKDRIDGAIKRASSAAEGDNFEEVRYEGYAPGGVALIIEALTDNRNRTAGEIRSLLTKAGGSLGESGSVAFMFDHIGLIEYDGKAASEEAMLEAAIEAGAEDVESNTEWHFIICNPTELSQVRDNMIQKFGEPKSAKLTWKAKSSLELSPEQSEKIMKLIDALEDNDDVQSVTGNFNLSGIAE